MTQPHIDQYITFIYTEDLAASATFYAETLGLTLWRDQGTCRIYHVAGDAYLGVCQMGPHSKGIVDGETQRNVILTLITEDVDGWYTKLRTHGVVFEKAPEHNPRYNIYHCFLRDPSGYLIEIQRFLD